MHSSSVSVLSLSFILLCFDRSPKMTNDQRSGERTRLACPFRRPRRNALVTIKGEVVLFTLGWRARGRTRQHARRVRSPERFAIQASSFIRQSAFVLRHFF